jgi:hypothetical protein
MTLWFLLPIRIPGLGIPSDGYLILHLLRSKTMEEHFEKIHSLFEKNIKPD